MTSYNLNPNQIADLRQGGTQVIDTTNGQVQLCGPGSLAIEFVDATNVYLSEADLDRINQESRR